jgi:peptide chain release factor subunit 1
MATTLTNELLRDLAGVRASRGCAVSLYLDLDPQSTVNAGDVQTRVNSLLDLGGRTSEPGNGGMDREQRQALRDDVERIRAFFASEFDRSGARGFALFASGLDNLWLTLPLADPVGDAVRVARDLYLAPLLPLAGGAEGALVAVVSRERGEVYRVRGGRLEVLVNEFEAAPNRHDQGGWSQARYQRHVEEVVARHLRNVTGRIDRRVRREPSTQLVVAAAEELRPVIEDALAPESRKAIVGWTAVEAHTTGPELLDAARPILVRARAEREREALDRWHEEAGRDGRATAGWESTLEAASDGRVDVLLVQEAANVEAYQCPECGRGSLTDGSCPLDGARMEKRHDGLDLAAHKTLEHGGSVWVARASGDLGETEGIGALLRF